LKSVYGFLDELRRVRLCSFSLFGWRVRGVLLFWEYEVGCRGEVSSELALIC